MRYGIEVWYCAMTSSFVVSRIKLTQLFYYRELKEECGLIASKNSLFKHGVLWFEIKEMADLLYEVHLFTVHDYHGEVTESDGKLACTTVRFY